MQQLRNSGTEVGKSPTSLTWDDRLGDQKDKRCSPLHTQRRQAFHRNKYATRDVRTYYRDQKKFLNPLRTGQETATRNSV